MLENKKIGIGMSASFCSLEKSLKSFRKLKDTKANLTCVMSDTLYHQDSRFMKKEDLKNEIKMITDKDQIITTIHEAELLGPKYPLDALVVLPCTANTLSKITNGICDNALTMAIKATLRNQKPVILGIFTNDALGNSGENIMKLMKTKNIFFIPFGQDDCVNKPNSMVCNPGLLIDTLEKALLFQQIQPVITSPL